MPIWILLWVLYLCFCHLAMYPHRQQMSSLVGVVMLEWSRQQHTIVSYKSNMSLHYLCFSQLLRVMWVLGGHFVQNPINHHKFRKEKFKKFFKKFTVDVYIVTPLLPSPPIHLESSRREDASLLFVYSIVILLS